MDQLVKLARKDFERVKALNKQTVNANKTLIESTIVCSNARERMLSADDAQISPEENKRNNNVFSQWIDASSIKGFQLNKFWK